MALTVELGGHRVALESSDSTWLELAARRYSDFLVEGEPAAAVRYHVRAGSGALAPGTLARARRRGAEVWRCGARGWGWSASWADGGRTALIEGPRHVYPVDLLLPALWYLLEPSGVLVHGVLLDIAGQGVVGLGASGRGKSTLARLAVGRALSDEMVALVPRAGALHAASLPFWAGRPGQVRVRELLLLEHGMETRRIEVPAVAAVARIAQQVIWPPTPERAATALEVVAALVPQVPVRRFPFRPDAAALEVLAA